jgi:hypothetical protein
MGNGTRAVNWRVTAAKTMISALFLSLAFVEIGSFIIVHHPPPSFSLPTDYYSLNTHFMFWLIMENVSAVVTKQVVSIVLHNVLVFHSIA